jgi:hypothetical protein
VSKQSIRQTYSVLKLHFARIFSTFVYRHTASTSEANLRQYRQTNSTPYFFLKVASCPFFLNKNHLCCVQDTKRRKILPLDQFCKRLRTLLLLSEGEYMHKYLLRESCGTLKNYSHFLLFALHMRTVRLCDMKKFVWIMRLSEWHSSSSLYTSFVHKRFRCVMLVSMLLHQPFPFSPSYALSSFIFISAFRDRNAF